MIKAREMVNYMRSNGLGKGFSKWEEVRHFKVIEKYLMRKEEVLTSFMGLQNFQTLAQHDGTYAYAITNKGNLLLAKRGLRREYFDLVIMEEVKAIYKETGKIYGKIIFETNKGSLVVGVDNMTLGNIYDDIKRHFGK